MRKRVAKERVSEESRKRNHEIFNTFTNFLFNIVWTEYCMFNDSVPFFLALEKGRKKFKLKRQKECCLKIKVNQI